MGTTTCQTLVLANPNSANGSLGRKWPRLERQLRQALGRFDHQLTAAPGEATTLARRALERGEHQLVVAMGGDGTVSEVVNGFFTDDGPVNPEVALGVLPYGTGGDFRKAIGAPKNLAHGARSLGGSKTRQIDVGRMTYCDDRGAQRARHFVNIASFGIGGLVDQLVNSSSKALGGTLSFALASVRAMRRFKAQRALVRLDHGPEREVELHNVAVANGNYFGGGMHIAPGAMLDDGLFDVVTLGPMSMRDLLLSGHRIYAGTHLELPQVSLQRARRVEARPSDDGEAILLDVDGETPGRLPATFEVLPGALRLKVPRP